MRKILDWMSSRLASHKHSPDGMISAVEKGPWGDGGSDEPKKPRGPKNPWAQPQRGPRAVDGESRPTSALDELLKRGRGGLGGSFGGGGSKFSSDRPIWLYVLIGFLALWAAFTSIHVLAPGERGVVTQLGSYDRTVGPGGIQWTLPAPFERMTKIDTLQIRELKIGSEQPNDENLVLTGDQNIVDLAYQVRWSIADPELFLFQLDDPAGTIREVAESAMRATVANFSLNSAITSGRSDIEAQVQLRMQTILDQYRSGVQIDGIQLVQTGPPAEVDEAFKEVNSSKQESESFQNEARAYAQQVLEAARGESAAFDKVYAEYRLAPEVTKRRMYYDTMQNVLGSVDKTIIEADGVTPYLPLPELRRRAQSRPTATAPATSQVTVTEQGASQ